MSDLIQIIATLYLFLIAGRAAKYGFLDKRTYLFWEKKLYEINNASEDIDIHPHILKFIRIAELQVKLMEFGAIMEHSRYREESFLSLTKYIIEFNESPNGLPLPIYIDFKPNHVTIVNQTLDRVYYDSTTWQHYVLNKVKECIELAKKQQGVNKNE